MTIQAMLFPFAVMLGLILAWWFERMGGLVAAVSISLFYVLEYLGGGSFPGGWAFMLISAPSVIFVCCGSLSVIQMNDTTAEPNAEGNTINRAP